MELLEGALARSGAERDVWLESACQGDGELLREVKDAIDWEQRMAGFLQTPVTLQREPEPDPERIGDYQIIRRLGEGGMGVVYHARQTHPIRRDIALKVVRPGMDSRQIVARFESERQALAMSVWEAAHRQSSFDPHTANLMVHRLVEMYKDWDKPDKAREWEKKVDPREERPDPSGNGAAK